jgi:hypothetical protein
MDESDSPALHRFLSFCRLFMCDHPRQGAQSYAISLGDSTFKPGWTALHRSDSRVPGVPEVMYMCVSKEGGRLTPNKPDCPDEEIRHFYEDDLPQLHTTSAWRQAQALAEVLGKQNDPRFPPHKIASVMENIARVGYAPLRRDDGTIEKLFDSARLHMKSVIDSIADALPIDDFLRPAHDVVERYMAFELCRTHAANALSQILSYYSMRFPSPLSEAPPAKRFLDATRHLLKRTYGLLKYRNNLNLTSFYEATYLALLYGETAILNYKLLLSEGLAGEDDVQTIKGDSFAVDEKMAHEAWPSMKHPMLLVPFGFAEFMCREKFGIVDTTGLYPGAVGHVQKGSDPKDTLEAIRLYSSTADATVIAETLKNENSPIDEVLKHHLATFLLTMAIGKRMP